jgi:hypothetical protein
MSVEDANNTNQHVLQVNLEDNPYCLRILKLLKVYET